MVGHLVEMFERGAHVALSKIGPGGDQPVGQRADAATVFDTLQKRIIVLVLCLVLDERDICDLALQIVAFHLAGDRQGLVELPQCHMREGGVLKDHRVRGIAGQRLGEILGCGGEIVLVARLTGGQIGTDRLVGRYRRRCQGQHRGGDQGAKGF